MDEKVALVEAQKRTYSLNQWCQALGLSKSTVHYRRYRVSPEVREAVLKAAVVSILQRHPSYGYRRIREELEAHFGAPVNHKRLRKLLVRYE